MDSITFIKIVVAIEETFEIEVPDEKLLITEMNTVSKIIEIVSFALKDNITFKSDIEEKNKNNLITIVSKEKTLWKIF